MKNNVIVLGIVLLFATACDNKNIRYQITDCLTIKVEPEKALTSLKLSEIFAKIEYIPLETNWEHPIGEIIQILIYKNRIYLVDAFQTKSIFCYDMTGKFLYELAKNGKGPGEWTELGEISINFDHDVLLIKAGYQIHEYNLDGNYISSHPIDTWNATKYAYTGNNCIAFYGNFLTDGKFEKNGMIPNLLIYKDYHLIDRFHSYPASTQGQELQYSINVFSPICKDTVSLWETYNDTIYHLTAEEVRPVYYYNFGSMKRDNGFYELMHSAVATHDKVEKYLNDRNQCQIVQFTETENCLFIQYHHRNIYHYAFYNRKTGKMTDVKMEANTAYPMWDDINTAPFAPPYFTDGHSFYGYLDAYEITDVKEQLGSELKEKFKDLKEEDNPIIVVMTPN